MLPIDGSSISSFSSAGAGWVIKGPISNCTGCLPCKVNSVLQGEAYAIFTGSMELQNFKDKPIVMVTNCMILKENLQGYRRPEDYIYVVTVECKHLLEAMVSPTIFHKASEDNEEADFLSCEARLRRIRTFKDIGDQMILFLLSWWDVNM